VGQNSVAGNNLRQMDVNMEYKIDNCAYYIKHQNIISYGVHTMNSQFDELLKSIRADIKTFIIFSPINLAVERKRFFKSNFYNPQLVYPAIETDELKSAQNKLHKIKLHPDSSLENRIFNDRIRETKLKLRLFLSIGDPNKITRISQKLYQCKFDQESIRKAKYDANSDGVFSPQENFSAKEFRSELKNYLEKYGLRKWKVRIKKDADFYIQIRHKKELIIINEDLNWDFNSLDSALAHEIDGHVVRAINAIKQDTETFQNSLPFYIKTEEGLASYLGDYCAEGGKLALKHHAIKYLGGYIALHNSFREVYNFFIDNGFTPNLAFQRAFRLKRGFIDTSSPGVFAREAIYYEGMLEVKKYIEEGGSIRKLFAGKVGLKDLKYIPVPKDIIIPNRIQSKAQIS